MEDHRRLAGDEGTSRNWARFQWVDTVWCRGSVPSEGVSTHRGTSIQTGLGLDTGDMGSTERSTQAMSRAERRAAGIYPLATERDPPHCGCQELHEAPLPLTLSKNRSPLHSSGWVLQPKFE